MFIFIISIALLVPLLALSIYNQHGKRQIFQLDLVQFIYLFVFMPVLFIWAKAFLFYLLNNEVGDFLSPRDSFVIDTMFSIVSFYLFSAVSIHTLTKSIALRKNSDPDFDIFHMSEYFHLWWSHIVMYVGGMFAVSFLSTLNVIIPMTIANNKSHLFIAILVSIIIGVMFFISIWSADPKQERRKFLRMMKLFLMFFSIYHIMLYFVFDPKFSMNYVIFWFILTGFMSAAVSSFSLVRSKKVRGLHKRLTPDWGENIDLFPLEESVESKK